MRRYLAVALLASFALAPLGAQAPEGWMMRIDRSMSAADPDAPGNVRFMAAGPAFHATTPQAAVFWHPDHTASGTYTIKGTFKLLKPSGHTNYYGLVFGGAGLDAATQRYIYFMVAQDGTWLVKRREGSRATSVSEKTRSSAVKTPDANGQSVNTLEVRVAADKIDYVVNGTVVHSTPRSGPTATTDGTYGLRVNHLLDVEVTDFGISG